MWTILAGENRSKSATWNTSCCNTPDKAKTVLPALPFRCAARK
jgi:hypothetical protein